ncbi:hypothetical protein PGQ11_001700 [Apiospora arundinis]|uniref:Uncharacterized protein n=1 Tax=Apiospora arundinis TaxID=335852 RepID=A0ABR2JFR1_9PEZI
MLASVADTRNVQQPQQQPQRCIVCGTHERQFDGKCSSCGEDDAQMLDRPDHPHHLPQEDEDNSSVATPADTSGQQHNQWFDKHRQCEDGSVHYGKLELITWGGEEAGWELGWGRTQVSEADFMKKKYEQEFGGDDEKLYGYWPQGFR